MAAMGRTDPGFGQGGPSYPGTFLLAFREAVADLQWTIRQVNGKTVQCLDAEGREQTVGLENVFRMARRSPREEWPGIILRFLKTASSMEASEYLPENLADVADKLMVRLGPPIRLDKTDMQVWSCPIPGTPLHQCLVIDFADRMAYVTEDLVTRSGQPPEHWLDQAVRNLADKTAPDCFQVIDAETRIRMASAADAYDSSRVLLVDQLLAEHTADGFFVSLPARDQLFVLPLDAEAVSNVPLLKGLAEKSYQNTPYPICNEVFWLRQGIWRLFPIHFRGNQVTIEPPEEFVEVLRRLLPDEVSEEESDPPPADNN